MAIKYLEPGDFAGRARLLRLISQTWSAQQQYSEAEKAIGKALVELGDLPPEDPDSLLMQEWLKTRLYQIDCFYFQNRPEEMETLCEFIEGPIEQSGTLEQQADFCTLRGKLNNRNHRYRSSAETVQLARRSLKLAERAKDPLLIARKHFSLGFNLLWYGERQKAINQLKQALDLAENLGATFIQDQALAYLGIAYRMQGRQREVIILSQRGLTLAEAENHPTYQGVALANLAWSAYHQGDLEKAEQQAEKALQHWGSRNYPFEWLADFPLAAIRMKRGEIRLAQECLDAIQIPTQQWLPEELQTCLKEIVNRKSQGDPELARQAIQQALTTANRLGYL